MFEIDSVRRFKNVGNLIAYVSLDILPYQHGQFTATNKHLLKRGNKYLRKTGYETMKLIKSSCSSGFELYDYIVKKESKRKNKKVAKISVLNKFLTKYFETVRKQYKFL